MEIILLLPIVAFFCWLYAEAKLGMSCRVICGLLCIAATGFACHSLARIIPRYESTLHRGSLSLAGELLARGESARVQQAIQTYNSLASNRTTYAASLELWRVLNDNAGK